MLIFFFSGIFVFLLNYKYFMINLLSLEYMMLFLLFMIILMMNKSNIDSMFIMMFLTFMVTESVLGLSLLVLMIRNYGSNNLKNIVSLKF
uniref:NADH-ubiquinone oxidoreductase chain 4L n=1 Tax=Mayetiola destructor TaxID=39758 RepID=C7FIK0_MAYDE|nr:NADH dehydrogenase subunit 4l [Mayetiola destructor]